MAIDADIDASAPGPHQVSAKNYPYSPSSASTASSSSSSVFSIDAPSSQSSVSSLSGGWSSSGWINENENQHFSGSHSLQSSATSSNEEAVVTKYAQCQSSRVQLPTEAVALECRQNPRRAQRLNSCGSQDGKNANICPRAPPPLVRQSERKDNFVDSLVVDFALTEAAYTVVRLLLKFPVIRLPAGQKVELTGVEKQTITLVLSSTEGCMVDIACRTEEE